MTDRSNGGESSEDSGSASVADIVITPPQQTPPGKKFLSWLKIFQRKA